MPAVRPLTEAGPSRLLAKPTRPSAPALVVAAGMALYVAVFGTLTWRQQSNFGTFGFDMGIYDQGIWLVSRGRTPFVTVRGLNYFGHHVNLVTLLLVPAYWLGAGPHLLYLVETVALASCAVPVYLLGLDRLERPWAAAALALTVLLYPSMEWINWWHFHPDALIIAPLLWAYLFAPRRRWTAFAVACGVALTCKEDAALAVLVLGLLVAWRNRSVPEEGERRRGRRFGLAAAGAAAAWFVICTRVIIPHTNGGIGPLYEELFPGLGHTVPQIFFNAVRHPSRLLGPATAANRRTYYWKLLAPMALVPLLALPVLLIAGPQTLINVVSAHVYTYDIRFHYSSIVAAAVFLATVEGVARWRRKPEVMWAVVALVVATSVAANAAWSPSPMGRDYDTGIWAKPAAKHQIVNRAMAMIPASAGVSATYDVVPHLTHREQIFEYPNPWIVSNWGIHGERPPATGKVDWILLDEPLGKNDQRLFDTLTGPGGEFRIVLSEGGVTLARRISPAVVPLGPPPGYVST